MCTSTSSAHLAGLRVRYPAFTNKAVGLTGSFLWVWYRPRRRISNVFFYLSGSPFKPALEDPLFFYCRRRRPAFWLLFRNTNMPEGPSIVILREDVAPLFTGKKVTEVTGNSRQLDFDRIRGQTVTAFKSWGKHFLVCFPGFALRVHFMLFGSYRINEHKETEPRLGLHFGKKGELNFYAASVKFIEEPLDEVYDWSADVLSPVWDPAKALKKLEAAPETLVCDALLDQHLFAGVGNIIKNEVLFRIRVHPLSLVGKLGTAKRKELVQEAENYSHDFLRWKREFTLKKHWLAHTKTICPRDGERLNKAYLGKTNRRTYYCTVCQKLYT